LATFLTKRPSRTAAVSARDSTRWAEANRRGRQALVCEAMDPTRDIGLRDLGQGYELPSRQDLPTHCDLPADHHGRLQLDLTCEPLRQPFSDRDLGEGSGRPTASDGDLLRCQPALGVALAREVPGVLAMVCAAIACPPLPVRASLDVTGHRRHVCPAKYAPLPGHSGMCRPTR
jgi:hypothetical protein